ncbi:MAG: flippase-like domain-containing protein [Solirubrobacterales bacterium]|nr:flippase-like domain-containing protein [Solirubrobacterales bacterium]
MSALSATGVGRGLPRTLPISWRGIVRALRAHPRRVLVAIVVAAGIAGAFLLAPALARLPHELRLIGRGDVRWLLLGFVLEALSFAGQVLLFRSVYRGSGAEIGYRDSYEITLAGHAATRLLASAGTGGMALTVWALRRQGLRTGEVARRMIAFLVLMYSVYTVALLVGGIGLATGALSGGGSLALTLFPAALAATVGALALAAPVAGAPLARVLRRRASNSERRFGVAAGRLAAAVEALGDGVRLAITMVRERRCGLIGAPMWWGFDVAVLWASFHAFGAAPPLGVILMAYFVGTLANTLPLPGGIGGVEGGMIGALVAFGVHPALAVVAVLAYRLYAFWLPTIPGAIAYLQLRRNPASSARQKAEPQAALA